MRDQNTYNIHTYIRDNLDTTSASSTAHIFSVYMYVVCLCMKPLFFLPVAGMSKTLQRPPLWLCCVFLLAQRKENAASEGGRAAEASAAARHGTRPSLVLFSTALVAVGASTVCTFDFGTFTAVLKQTNRRCCKYVHTYKKKCVSFNLLNSIVYMKAHARRPSTDQHLSAPVK